ncbi:MAG: transposase [Eubacteriaceae bacterium]|nr:transposase [Eubacteriaceae bacterium]
MIFEQYSNNNLETTLCRAIELMLEAGLDKRLGYGKHSPAGNNSGNSHNGYGKKTISSEW